MTQEAFEALVNSLEGPRAGGLELAQHLVKNLPLPGDAMVIVFNVATRKLRRRMQRVPDSHVYEVARDGRAARATARATTKA